MTDQPASDVDLSELGAVVAKIDAKVAEVADRRRTDLMCEKGCAQCCVDGLTVLPIEAAAVLAHADAHRSDIVVGAPEQGCAFLDAAGACQVYAGRPLLCRTHGLPLRQSDKAPRGALRVLDDVEVCALNFTDSEPGPDDVIDATLVQALLTTVNARAGLDDGRIALRDLAEALAKGS